MLKCLHCGLTVPNTAITNALCANCWVERNDDKPPCAWCYPGSAGNSIGSHGICPQHSAEMIAEVQATARPIEEYKAEYPAIP